MARWSKARVRLALNGADPKFGPAVAIAIFGAILLSATVLTVRSLPSLSDWLDRTLGYVEVILLAFFGAEYAMRLWSAPSRWRYALSLWGLIDLIAILPALLFLIPDTQSLRLLRLLRVFRLLKLLRMRRALERLEYALAQSRDELILFSFLAAIVLFLTAVGIHHLEKTVQPDTFGSIPQSLWWALATLTTVGYGDVYPVTTGGKVFTALTLLVGLGIVAIPAGIITSALISAPEKEKNHGKRPAKDRP
ncbi:ion transporter [Antarctobacter sp.]|uniref:ion transporter n=1 Tax=Antarctobacter sp. TaxID=1872577 RepID=UPI003A936F27